MNVFDLARLQSLSAEALGVALWIAAQPAEYEFRVEDAKFRFAVGNYKWSRISKELRKAGALIQHRIGGTFILGFERESINE